MNNSESDYDDASETDEHPVLSPPLFFRSFLTIASSSIACLLVYAIIGVALAGLFFPKIWDAMTGGQAEVAAAVAIPVAMLVPWLILQGIACLGIGWMTAKVAPFAPEKHGLILAFFLFIAWVQKVLESSPDKVTLNMVFTVVVPLAIAYGARMYCDKHVPTELKSGETSGGTPPVEETKTTN